MLTQEIFFESRCRMKLENPTRPQISMAKDTKEGKGCGTDSDNNIAVMIPLSFFFGFPVATLITYTALTPLPFSLSLLFILLPSYVQVSLALAEDSLGQFMPNPRVTLPPPLLTRQPHL